MTAVKRANQTKLIDFVVRSDAIDKPGGDTHQVDQYAKALAKLGFSVQVSGFRIGMRFRPGAIVHVVNVDRPFDFLAALRAAEGHTVVVSTIHHDLSYVRLMREAEVGQGLRSLVGRLLPESGRELLAFAIRSSRQVDSIRASITWAAAVVRAAVSVSRVWQLVGRELERVHSVTLLARGEARALKDDTGWSGENAVLIPNGVPKTLAHDDHSESGADWCSRPVDICVVGRVEPRKRTLEIAKAALAYDLRCVFVGPLSKSARRYADEFSELAAADERLTWLGSLPHQEVQSVMRSARVLLNASWVEVQSLVDIEGTTNGCWVVTGPGGNSGEWLGGRLIAVDCHDLDVIMPQVKAILLDGRPPCGPIYSHTWEEAGRLLAAVYKGQNFTQELNSSIE